MFITYEGCVGCSSHLKVCWAFITYEGCVGCSSHLRVCWVFITSEGCSLHLKGVLGVHHI